MGNGLRRVAYDVEVLHPVRPTDKDVRRRVDKDVRFESAGDEEKQYRAFF